MNSVGRQKDAISSVENAQLVNYVCCDQKTTSTRVFAETTPTSQNNRISHYLIGLESHTRTATLTDTINSDEASLMRKRRPVESRP